MNHTTHNAIVNFIWGIADDVLRDVYVRGKYRDVILPMTVIRRLDVLLEPTKDKVLETQTFLDKKGIHAQASALMKAAGRHFYNTSKFTLRRLLDQPSQLRQNFEAYLDGFSENVQEIIRKFDFRNQLNKLAEANVLYLLVEKFLSKEINLGPEPVRDADGKERLPGLSNLGMGYVFEELIRRFNEENNEEAGEHFTPREIIRLMASLIFLPIKDQIQSTTYLVYDCACGTGGMLTEAESFIQSFAADQGKKVAIELYGQEINPETFAICQSDMLIKERRTDNIKYGSTLSRDGFPSLEFDFMLSNPPYGKSWKIDMEALCGGDKKEMRDPRFLAQHCGEVLQLVPRSNDGQLLFLVNFLSKMKTKTTLGSRVATVQNGSSLFTGDAGQGESNIRRWIIENDWLEAIIALPLNMFYNTNIATYIWVLSNRKSEIRRGKVQLIDATEWCKPLVKNLGKKNCELSDEDIAHVVDVFLTLKESPQSKVFPNEAFGYWKITVERPLRIPGIDPGRAYKPAEIKKLKAERGVSPDAPPVIRTKSKDDVEYEPDPDLRDVEQVPLLEKGGVEGFFRRQVLPYAPDAWIDDDKKEIGYEISFTRHFYKPAPLRTLDEISAEILSLEKENEGLLGEIIGGRR